MPFPWTGQVLPWAVLPDLSIGTQGRLCLQDGGLAWVLLPTPLSWSRQVPGLDLSCLQGWAVEPQCEPRGTARFPDVAFLLSARSSSADRTRACCSHTVCVWSLSVELAQLNCAKMIFMPFQAQLVRCWVPQKHGEVFPMSNAHSSVER